MTPEPLQKVRWSWNDHKSALYWLGLLYRRPAVFCNALEEITKTEKLKASFFLSIHFLPYLTVFTLIIRIVLLEWLQVPLQVPASLELTVFSDKLIFHAKGIAVGIAFGIAVGIALEIADGITYGIAGGITFGIAGGITFGITGGIAFGIAAIISLLRLYYFPFYFWLSWPKFFGKFYPYHPVAWDDMCSVPFSGLDRLLVAYTEIDFEAGKSEIERLVNTYPSQRIPALRAKSILIGQESGEERNLANLSNIVSGLPEGNKGFLAETKGLREMIHEISQSQIRLDAMQRPYLREPHARLLYVEIENFKHRVSGFHEPLASEFGRAADFWLKVAEEQVQEINRVMGKKSRPQVFRAGDPVDRNLEAFIPRYNVIEELERQILLSTGCPGLVLYGRRRTGKSTILMNLNGFLSTKVIPVYISMQNPEAFSSTTYLIEKIVGELDNSLSLQPTLKAGESKPCLPELYQKLFKVNEFLKGEDRRLLLVFDEYEKIDIKIGEAVFTEDLLATIRESIQMHRNITWIFSGSHEITELTHTDWTSYLVSARTIEVPMFTLEETRMLLTKPLEHSCIWPKDAPDRPSYPAEFWGENGIEHIHMQAGGWPHLVQLLAETIVDLLTDQEKQNVDDDFFKYALNKAIVRGHNVMHQLMEKESEVPGEWDYLTDFRSKETQPIPEDPAIYRSLRRRQIIEDENGEWRLRVPLLAWWLRERG